VIDCAPPEFLSPAASSVVAEARPLVALRPQPGVTPRLFVEVRTPEKEILRRLDLRLGSGALQLPLGDSIYRATVSMRASVPCGAGKPAIVESRFYIDTGLACPAPARAAIAAGRLTWERPAAASATLVAFFDSGSARELARETLPATASSAVVPASGIVAALRSRCGEGLSAPAFAYGD
jgi:hypothetical protein